ncbi:TetR/AcrR family transcriptional regulator [Azospirillum sp. SYSU D00513]|uniref:TetR/AcrR family transcriptional regulator n=1 Tax=Azospirillum sp. SYSU D00513 TaxID=2812561 RepID=UPI001A95B950|nr:TetR/AcrR family transcriptional regulator [Azospirillum sp. SYSU D00513]
MKKGKDKPEGAARPARRMPGAEAQSCLLDAAVELFHREGVRAVGVDAVVRQAGVNKMSLYRQFASKDELVSAYLRRKDEEFWRFWEDSLSRHPGDPRRQMVQLFVDMAAKAAAPGYRGCPFVNVAAEFPDPEHPVRLLVIANKAKLNERLAALAESAGAADPQWLASALALLIEGAYAASQTYGPGNGPFDVLPSVAERLIEAALPPKDPFSGPGGHP